MRLFSRLKRSNVQADTASSSLPNYPLDSKHPEASSDKSGAGDDSSIHVVNPGGELTFEEGEYPYLNDSAHLPCFVDVQGGMGRHLGIFSCTMLM
jgi:hypothetical protein